MDIDYDEEFASYFIHNRVSEFISERLEPEEIRIILSIEWDYLDSLGLSEPDERDNFDPIDVDEDELEYYVIFEAVKHNIYLTYPDLREIISIELDYMEEIGLVKKLEELEGK